MLIYKIQNLCFHHLLVSSYQDFCRDVEESGEEHMALSKQGQDLQFSGLYNRYRKALVFTSLEAELSNLSARYGPSL